MPRSYGTGISDIESGSPNDFLFFISLFFLYWIYDFAWGKVFHTEPKVPYILAASVVTLFIVPPGCWLYFAVGYAVLFIGYWVLRIVKA